MKNDPKAILKRRMIALINTASGGCDASAAEQMKAVFVQAGLDHAEVIDMAPPDIDATLKRAVAAADIVVVLGGDGTIRAAAAACSNTDKLLIPLPGGTMNMLPKALYGSRSWVDALAETLSDPQVHVVSGGRAESELFFCAAVLGAPSLWADAREAIRRGDFIEAVRRSVTAIRRSASEPLTYRMEGGAPATAEAIAVICPLVSRALREDELSLEAAAIEPVTASALFRLAFHAIFDDWRNDPSISLARVKRLEARGHGRVPVILDGEKVRMGRVVRVEFVPVGFHALAPAGQAA